MEEIKELIEKAIDKLKADDTLMASFQKDPIKVVEKLLGVDLPDDMVEKDVHWYLMMADSYYSKPQREEYFAHSLGALS